MQEKSESLLGRSNSDRVVRVKSGTMDGVKAFAGYVVSPQGRTLAFCVISNGHDCTSHEATDKLNRIVAKIANL